MRSSVETFATKMEEKLVENDSKSGWKNKKTSVLWLQNRLKEEMSKLKIHYEDSDPAEIKKDCIDIANYAMMMFDRIQCREE